MPLPRFLASRSPSSKLFWLLLLLLAMLAGIVLFYHQANQRLVNDLRNTNRIHAANLHVSSDILGLLGTLQNQLSQLVEDDRDGKLDYQELNRRMAGIEARLAQLQQLPKELLPPPAQQPNAQQIVMLQREIARNLDSFELQASGLLLLVRSDTQHARQQAILITRQVRDDLEQLSDLVQLQEQATQQAFDSYLAASSSRFRLVEIPLLSLVLCIVLLMMRTFHRIGSQMRHTERALRQLSAGNTAIELPSRNDSSFQPIVTALQRFRQSLEDNQQTQQQLEQQVQDRTAHLQTANQQLADEIAQRREAEKHRRLFEIVFRNTDNAVLITTPDSLIITANQAYLQMTGRSLEELVGKRPPISSSGHHAGEFYQRLWHELSHRGRWQGEIVNRHVDGALVHALLTINAVYDADGTLTHYVGILSDITQMKAAENQLRRMAYFDPLTALPNRVMLKNRLEHEIEIAREAKKGFAVVMLDLDRFKFVNDTMGHKAGDELLMDVAERLRGTVKIEDTVARLSGDEFCLILRDGNPSQLALSCEAILQVLNLPFRLSERDAEIGASLGIAMFPTDGEDVITLLKHADAAMYQSKSLGRNRYSFFEPALGAKLHDEMELFTQLRAAVKQRAFTLFYQPIIPLQPELPGYAEALLRWPQGGSHASPGVFIPFAENHGLIDAIGDFVLDSACDFIARSQGAGSERIVSINLSAKQLAQGDLTGKLARQVAAYGIAPASIELELTESSLIQDLAAIGDILQQLREAGFRIAIDDFGAGYSSLNYLVELPVDKVKIDQRFIGGLADSPRNQAVVAAILELARAIGVQTVAEGVETAEQLAFLRAHGCHYAQGYYFARPMAEADYRAFVPPAG
ncbi:EAL domain-containing protein [Vogesella sp. LIG4]|uniref:EAL domain-containing protein n=1 Tax=Vogesella sp. LIG4 TaxID=1192162 RepID=UPI0008201510|nr:EAL domain-containing protein [Vogesella sp. LIG4]SCK05026.1 PAS domain S-box-containing protein/diguanylate cyclase (GGDEF) domain-containing protein [Vogesella sp. LIG4]